MEVRGNVGRSGGLSIGSGTGLGTLVVDQGTLGEVLGTLGEVRDGSRYPQGGSGRVG